MIIEKGVIFSISDKSDKQEKYIVVERIEDIGGQGGGWICFNWDAVLEKGSENISAFDCWRVTDRYLEIQLQRGVIKLVETI